ncbi:MAG: hypothetical protein JKX74_02275, partial [Flavobacteriales bacterium]|nr:hypothetical protein [Flavobacteriales bacterium]
GEDKKVSNLLLPLFYSYRDKEKQYRIIFPLAWSLRSDKYKSLSVPPLFSFGFSADSSQKHLAITPLFWKFSDRDNRKNVLFPFWWNFKQGSGDSARRTNILFPFYWSVQDEEKNNKVLFPLVWKHQNEQYQSLTVPPLFSRGTSADGTRKHLAVTPLYWAFANEDKQRNILFPLWWRKKVGTGENRRVSNLVLPLYYSYRYKKKSHSVVFPLVWKLKNERYRSLTVAPLFSKGTSEDSTRKHLAITPFYWALANKDTQRNIFFPLWWRRETGTGEAKEVSNLLLPLYYTYYDKETSNKVVFPLIWKLKNERYKSLTVAPLFSKGESADGTRKHFVFTPLYWQFSDHDKKSNVVLPLWWHFKSGVGEDSRISSVLFPLYFSFKDKERTSKVFFPLVWKFKNEKYRSLTVPPLYSQGKSADGTKKHLMLTPLYWQFANKDRRSNTLFPLWWHSKSGSGEHIKRNNVVFPLYWASRDQEKNNKLLFPLVWNFSNKKYRSLTIPPLFSVGHSPDGEKKHLAITPLFWRTQKSAMRSTVLVPIFKYSSDNDRNESSFNILYFLYRYKQRDDVKQVSFLWPLGISRKATDEKYWQFAPFLWRYKSEDHRYFAFQPFYYHNKNTEFESHRFLWELFVHKNYANGKRSRSFLWRSLIINRYDNNDHELRLFWLLYANINKEGNTLHSIFPLYHRTGERNGNKSLSLFFHFYNSHKKKIEGTDEYYQEKRIFWFIRFLSNYKHLEKKGIRVT